MVRREFLLGLGAAGLISVRPVLAQPRLLRPPDTGSAPHGQSVELVQLLHDVRLGESRAHDGMTVFWLHAKPALAPLTVTTLDDARARGDLTITEGPRASVPTLTVNHRGRDHVLLVAGEILLGGKQDRVVKEDVLLPPRSGPREIAVYCVEPGRWTGETGSFHRQGGFAGPQVRAKLLQRVEQRQVWDAVSQTASRTLAASPTGSYQAVFDKPEIRAGQRAAERALDRPAAGDARGAAVFLGERLAGLDVFLDVALFSGLWPKLLRGYTAEGPAGSGPAPAEDGLRSWLQALIIGAGSQPGTLRRNAGLGQLFEFVTGPARGSALIAEGQVVHAALL